MKQINNIFDLCQWLVFSATNEELKKALEIKSVFSFNDDGQFVTAEAFGADGSYQVKISTFRRYRTNCSCPHHVFRLFPAMRRSFQVDSSVQPEPLICKHGLSVAIRFLQWSHKNVR